jgi:hypothetical protein
MAFLRFLMAAITAAIFLCNTAWADSPAKNQGYLFPDTAIALQDGDIILTDTPKLSSALIREFSSPIGKYSHATVYIDFPDGTGKLVSFSDHGIKVIDPDKYLSGNDRLALMRPLAKPPKGALAAAFEQLSARPLLFDFDMKWPSIESNKTYCAGFISQLFRMSGLAESDPFQKSIGRKQAFWEDWALQHLGLSLSHIVAPNVVLSDAHFKLLSEYQAKDRQQDINYWISETTFHTIMQYIQHDQLEISTPKLGSGLALKLSKIGLIEGMDLLNMPEERLKVFVPLWEYSKIVETRVNHLIYIHEDQQWDETSIRALTKSVADYYRDNYFVSQHRK